MVRFLGVASLLFFSYIAVVAADSIPTKPPSDSTIALFGRALHCNKGEGGSYGDFQLKQLAYSLSAQISALVRGYAATPVTIVAPSDKVDVRA